MKQYKAKMYSKYITTHNGILYGEKTLEKMNISSSAWNHYYGKHFPQKNDCRILDIGCGDGNFIYWLGKKGYKNSMGIDVSTEMVASGKKLGIENLFCIDLFEFLKSTDQKFDVVIARDVIEHFEKDEVFEIFELVSSRLNEGGRFIIQVPNGQGLFYTSIFYGDYTHECAYTATSVSQIALNTGFTGSECFPVGPAPTSLFSQIRYFLWQYKVATIKFWKMVETGNGSGIFTQNLIAVITK